MRAVWHGERGHSPKLLRMWIQSGCFLSAASGAAAAARSGMDVLAMSLPDTFRAAFELPQVWCGETGRGSGAVAVQECFTDSGGGGFGGTCRTQRGERWRHCGAVAVEEADEPTAMHAGSVVRGRVC